MTFYLQWPAALCLLKRTSRWLQAFSRSRFTASSTIYANCISQCSPKSRHETDIARQFWILITHTWVSESHCEGGTLASMSFISPGTCDSRRSRILPHRSRRCCLVDDYLARGISWILSTFFTSRFRRHRPLIGCAHRDRSRCRTNTNRYTPGCPPGQFTPTAAPEISS